MSQHIEIEFKNLLKKEEFSRLQTYFKLDGSKFKKQVNHYFDTSSFSLKNAGSALRIREKGNQYELTLKQPDETGLLETSQILSGQEASAALQHSVFPEGIIKDSLANMRVDTDSLVFFGSLTTLRAEKEYENGLIVLDHSYYLNKEDFELEYEVTDAIEGLSIFNNLLEELNIPKRETDNKIKRFYNEKYKQLRN
ncbi:CYTH domain-containing protein [Bacillus sp. T33-2]|uniref:CYTH domain-containing protein n=1 Tax=Bacillus sp. T33-2 TaxID=2054168 RepID=UPI000C7911D8|nr:CYTH domain-containing protein [Bacillus sp. T33-2]PLR97600.1 CYTH domain-containing protein [Bacillus sp. T33-2]